MKNRALMFLLRCTSISVICLILIVPAFFLIEGASSTVLMINKIAKVVPIRERMHTKYDELLGWVNIPNVNIKDLYGKGNYLKTNSQGFRNMEEFGTRVPAGKTRIISSGDSFTLGFDVSNDYTWCNLLARKDARLEVINMGQGGYGVDQAYLWYMRDGIKFDHQVHILALTHHEIKRMRLDQFYRYGKPTLKLENDRLVTENVPVPHAEYILPRLAIAKSVINSDSKICTLLRKIYAHFFGAPIIVNLWILTPEAESLLRKVFESLQDANRMRDSQFVIIFLPTQMDYGGKQTDEWRRSIAEESSRRGILYIDIVEELRRLPADKIDELFRGHYSEKGNEFVANILYEKLRHFIR